MNMIVVFLSCLLTITWAAPSYVLIKGPLSFTDHFAASLMSPTSSGSSGSSSPTQSVHRPPALPNPPQSPRPPSSSSSSSSSSPSSSASSGASPTSGTGSSSVPGSTSSATSSVLSSGESGCPKDMIQSSNLNAIEVVERDACCPNSIGVFVGPAGCCALEHKSCTHTARCCDSSLECNTVAGATMMTCERVGVFTGDETTPSSDDKTTPVSETGSNTLVQESVSEQIGK